MQYNGNSDEQDLVSLLNDLTGMDNNVYTLKAKTRDMNTANRIIWQWIHEAYGGWLYDDANNTLDFPTATANVVANQRDYTLPSDALTVKGIEIKTTGNIWQELQHVTEEYIRDFMSEKQFMITASQPMYYTAYANSVRIYPATNYAQTSSIRISYDRGATNFTSTDTMKTPGFVSQFHDAVAYGAGVSFAKYKTLPQRQTLQEDWDGDAARTGKSGGWKKLIQDFYHSRWEDDFPTRITVRDAVREAM